MYLRPIALKVEHLKSAIAEAKYHPLHPTRIKITFITITNDHLTQPQ